MEQQRQYVGIDLHRRRSVIVRRDADGAVLESRRIDNHPAELTAVMAQAGPGPEVVLEAGYGWYWAADPAGRGRGPGAPGPPLGQQLGPSAGQERRA